MVEMEYRQGQRDLDATMRRLKDLSAYSLAHADILDKRQGVELLALAMFFGLSSNSTYHLNQQRLAQLAPDTFAYQGDAEAIAAEMAEGGRSASAAKDEEIVPRQPRLF